MLGLSEELDLVMQEDRRVSEVIRQRVVDGRTGGGPQCSCGDRAMYRMPEDDRWQCRSCGRGWRVKVTGDGIRLDEVLVRALCDVCGVRVSTRTVFTSAAYETAVCDVCGGSQ